MAKILRRVLLSAALLLLLAAACGSPEDRDGPPRWGSEAVDYFDRLAAVYTANDYYGVLDFYVADAYQEKWRGAIRGGSLVRDLLVWNSGDLGHRVLHTYLGPDGALTLVRWDTTGGLSAVQSRIEDGLIAAETVFDHSTWLDHGLRSSPGVLSTYDTLYEAYPDVWNSGGGFDELYTVDATVDDFLVDAGSGAFGSIAEAVDKEAQMDGVMLSQTVNGVNADGPAVFLGPADYGVDPHRAVGIFEITNGEGCVHQMAVIWQMVGDRIVAEQRYHAPWSVVDCRPNHRPTGWWTGLGLPMPSEEVVTGVIRTTAGQEIRVHNGTRELEQFVVTGIERFAEAGLVEPQFDSITFEPARRCQDRSGRLLQGNGSRDLFLCIYASDLCPGGSACSEPPLDVRSNLLHELAHAWILDQVDTATQTRLMTHSGSRTWDDDSVSWAERGVEYSAEVIAWGLLHERSPMVGIGAPPCEELANSFDILTGVAPLSAAAKCGG